MPPIPLGYDAILLLFGSQEGSCTLTLLVKRCCLRAVRLLFRHLAIFKSGSTGESRTHTELFLNQLPPAVGLQCHMFFFGATERIRTDTVQILSLTPPANWATVAFVLLYVIIDSYGSTINILLHNPTVNSTFVIRDLNSIFIYGGHQM